MAMTLKARVERLEARSTTLGRGPHLELILNTDNIETFRRIAELAAETGPGAVVLRPVWVGTDSEGGEA